MAQGTATSFAVPNFSGMLFAKGQTATPFSTMIGARPLVTNHVEFTCGQEYNTETGEQPEISETASLTAPQPEMVTRSQLTNVTQIFQKSVAISYGKQSNMGTLQGINVAGQQANPMDELAFQVSRRMAKIAQDIEYTSCSIPQICSPRASLAFFNAPSVSSLSAHGRQPGKSGNSILIPSSSYENTAT